MAIRLRELAQVLPMALVLAVLHLEPVQLQELLQALRLLE
jgi:hypothetical protein